MTSADIRLSIARFTATIQAVAPITGAFEKVDGTVGINFRPEATAPQRASANAAAAAFVWTAAAQTAWEDAQQPNRLALRNAVVAAIAANVTFLAIASPTATQVRDQTRAITQVLQHVLRRLAEL